MQHLSYSSDSQGLIYAVFSCFTKLISEVRFEDFDDVKRKSNHTL